MKTLAKYGKTNYNPAKSRSRLREQLRKEEAFRTKLASQGRLQVEELLWLGE